MSYLWQKTSFSKEELKEIATSLDTMNLEALTTLGLFYAHGYYDYPVSCDQATKILNIAMSKKHAQAFYVYAGLVLLDSFKGQLDESKSVAYLRKSAELGFDLAMAKLGEFYLDGIGLKVNYRDAERWLIKARSESAIPGLKRLISYYQNLGYNDKVLELKDYVNKFTDIQPMKIS